MSAVIKSTVHETRRIQSLKVEDIEKIDAPNMKPSVKAFNRMTHPNSHAADMATSMFCLDLLLFSVFRVCWKVVYLPAKAMKQEFQRVMKPKGKLHTWPATTQPGQWQEFGATQWLFEFRSHSEGHSVNAAWLTSLMDAGCVAACRSTSQLLLLLAVSQYTYAAWTLEIFRQKESGMVLIPCKAFSLTFGHVVNLEDWVTIPVKPALRGTLMVLVQTGPPLSVPEAKLQSGVQLTVQQCKDLLQALGITVKGAKTRADYLNFLVDSLFTSEVWLLLKPAQQGQPLRIDLLIIPGVWGLRQGKKQTTTLCHHRAVALRKKEKL